MSDIKREWIEAGAHAIFAYPGEKQRQEAERVLAAVLPLIAQRLRDEAGDPRPDAYMRGYYEGVAQGHLEAADLIWEEGTDE